MTRFALLAAFLASPALAQTPAFVPGPVFNDFGKTAPVDVDMTVPKGTVFKVVFDASTAGKPGELNRSLNSAARFMNMHVKAGMPVEAIRLALVFHGPASFDVANDAAYARQYPGKTNPNKAAVQAMLDRGIRIIICGQSIESLGIRKAELLPGVKVALSAMTAQALLQQQGYTLNPF